MVEDVYQSSPVGHHLICTFEKVPMNILVDHRPVLQVFTESLKRERYGIENVTVVYFSKNKRRDGKASYTMTLTLSESHMTVHGYPERSTMAFDFYTCRNRSAGWAIFEEITTKLDLRYYGLVSLERNVD